MNETINDKPTVQQIVETVLKDVEWLEETKARCACPGRHKHTTRSHRNDCFVFTNGVPTVSCLHDSCREEVAKANVAIRDAFNLFSPTVDEAAMALGKEKAAKRHALEAKAKASLPEILKQYRWDINEIEQSLPDGEDATYLFLQKMFKNDDVIWVGHPDSSGNEKHKSNFKKVFMWNADVFPYMYGNYTTASTYKEGSFSRANANVLTTPYMILECDKVFGEVTTNEQRLANKNACGAITRWLVDSVGLKLRAVVDSGSKSLHSWFEMPSPDKFEELKIVLPMMGADRAMWKPSQPARLAGVMRDNGNEQKLLYLK